MDIKNLTWIILLFQFIAALIGTLTRDEKDSILIKHLVYFLWITFFFEALVAILVQIHAIRTFWLYNGYILFSTLFYLYWFYNILEGKGNKKMIRGATVIFLVVWIVDNVTLDEQNLQKYSFLTVALITIFFAVLNFRQLLQSDETIKIRGRIDFWVAAGLLLFNMGMVPFMLLSTYFHFRDSPYYVVTIIVLNLILYGCYTIGFVWSKEKYNRS